MCGFEAGPLTSFMFSDLRFAIRQLIKDPGFTAIAVLSLALGIGGTTAVFSILNSTLLQPTPYQRAEDLVFVSPEKQDGTAYNESATGAQVAAWREAESFRGIAPYHWTFNFLVQENESQSIEGLQGTHEFFSVLGLQPLLGRTFTPEEKEIKDSPVVVLGYDLWQRRFAGDPNIINKTIRISRMPPLTVIGVMPPGVRFLPSRGAAQEPNYNLHAFVDYWIPETPNVANTTNRGWSVVARLAPGVSRAQAQAEMTKIAGAQAQADPAFAGFTTLVTPIHDVLDREIRRVVLPLFGAVGFVLLIAGANVAGLLLVRGLGRHRELAVRAALGAGRLQLLRLTLTESLLLALIGGVLGSGLAYAGTKVLLAVASHSIPRLNEVGIDWRVAGFAVGVSLLAGLVTGGLTAWAGARPDVNRALKDGARGTGRGPAQQRLLGVLVAGEVALTLVLLVGAGLMLQTMVSLTRVDPGYQTNRILTMIVTTLQQDRPAFHRRALEAVQPLPGVSNAAFAWGVPLTGNNWMRPIVRPGEVESAQAKDTITLPFRSVTPEYFELMGIALREGRIFDERDQRGAAPVVIINEAMARRYFPGQNPIGRKLVYTDGGASEIVGIVGDLRTHALNAESEPEVYMSFFQALAFSKHLVVRTQADPRGVIADVRRALQGVDPAVVIEEVKTMDAIRNQSIAAQRFAMTLIAAFAVMALVLSVVGLYGVMSHSVLQRSHEIGIRMAIGAQQHHVLRMILRQGATLVALGMIVGLVGALALTGTLRSLLYEVGAADPVTFVMVCALLIVVTLLACLLPARRATKIDPLVALRAE
jgi:putative ABC transport system permease protein